jgi:hypothetical protein
LNNRYLINDVYYFFCWGPQQKEDLFHAIEHYEIKKIIFFGPEEHEIANAFHTDLQFIEIKSLLKQKKIKYQIVVSANLDANLNSRWPYKNQKHFLSWEDFFAYQVVEYGVRENIKPFGHNQEITKHFISLNARSHPWRCLFVDHLYNEGLFDYGYVSWHNSDNWDYGYDFKYWKPSIINFDELWLSNTDGILNILHPPEKHYKDSLFSIISESNDQVLKITEKTYLPIYHQRPFLVHGPQHFHRMLKNQGFMLFDEIFDYSFDDIPNDLDNYSPNRCMSMLKETKKILNYDPNDLYKILKPKIDHNFKNLFSIVSKRNIDAKIKIIISNIEQNKMIGFNYFQILNVGEHPNFFRIYEENK